jgi:hypothetical protein
MHNPQKNMYIGIGAKGVEPMPSPMYLANVDCVGCHIDKKKSGETSQSQTFSGTEKGCLDCHGKEYSGILDDVHISMREAFEKLDKNLVVIKETLAKEPQKMTKLQEIKDELSQISYNLDFVKTAHSIHNIYYSAQIFRYIHDKLSSIAKKTDISIEDTSSLPIISGSFCATLCHSRVGVKVPSEKVMYKNKEMPHRQHFEQEITCGECHTFGAHKKAQLKKPTICSGCHEGLED